jgi:hypothetical protein
MSAIGYEEDEEKDVKVKRERNIGSSAAHHLTFNKPAPRQPKIEILELKVVTDSSNTSNATPAPPPLLPSITC